MNSCKALSSRGPIMIDVFITMMMGWMSDKKLHANC